MSRDLGRRLEELRRQRNLDKDDLARRLSVRRRDINQWETGKTAPDGEQLIKLSQLYKMPIDEILLNFDTENNFGHAQPQSAAINSANSANAVKTEPPKAKPAYNWHMFPYPVIVTGAYLIIGALFNMWHPTWLLFLTIPIYYMLVEVHNAKTFRHKANVFPFPIICVLFYLTLGFDYNLWHPMWIIFFTIPVYYMIVNGIKN